MDISWISITTIKTYIYLISTELSIFKSNSKFLVDGFFDIYYVHILFSIFPSFLESGCYNKGASRDYHGKRICTESGFPCQPWSSQSPHRHKFDSDIYFPHESLPEVGSFCRDPDGVRGQPWCYTNLTHIEWEYCDISLCKGSWSLGIPTLFWLGFFLREPWKFN